MRHHVTPRLLGYRMLFMTVVLLYLMMCLAIFNSISKEQFIQEFEDDRILYYLRSMKNWVLPIEIPPKKREVYIPPNPLFTLWRKNKSVQCGGKFEGYGHEFVKFKDILIDNSFSIGPKGGQNMSKVMKQNEELEFYTLKKGFFQIDCNSKLKYKFKKIKKNYLDDWIATVKLASSPKNNKTVVNHRFTIAMTRFEYVNVYHSMTYFYNAFLMMGFFNKTTEETDIIFIDAHPSGTLDPVFEHLFHSYKFLSDCSQSVLYTNLVWMMQGYNSPLLEMKTGNFPLAETFREFFLIRHDVLPEAYLNCENLTISFIWRRDYVAHPRNPTGLISRKVKNELELVKTLKDKYPYFIVKESQLDKLPMREQLTFVSQSDILIGMHGAGLTFAFFLPKHAGLIELFPNYWSDANSHMKLIAKRRNLHFAEWKNTNTSYEFPNKYTYVPPKVVNKLVDNMVQKICPVTKSQVLQKSRIIKSDKSNIKMNN